MATLHDGELDDPSFIEVPASGGGPPVPAVRLQLGETAPGTRYRIERWLGEGGVGVVYECRHVDIDRRVALKVLKSEVSPRTAKLFRDEARAAARTTNPSVHGTDLQFGSPYIVEVFDFGEFPDGRLWFAMELLSGQSLAQVLKHEGKPIAMEAPRAIGILRQMCKGLYTAHRAGIVHRDVKPANVMLVRRGGRNDCVKLVDFGVSAIASDQAAGQTIMVGTPPYMAPEQTSGTAFDHRLDIYAIGCVAYRMLTGRVPFAASTMFQLLRMHRESEPAPPSQVVEGIPPALERVVLRCLAKAADERYESMADLEGALCEAQVEDKLRTPWDDLPLPDVDPDRRERLLRLMPDSSGKANRPRWIWPAVAGVAVAISIGAVSLRPVPEALAIEQDDAVDLLVAEARAAGARAQWVYPGPDQPDGPTAYTKVLELEGRGPGAATSAAQALRKEFATALAGLGDRYWQHPQGRAFAMDYYAQAQLFDPATGGGDGRATMTIGELALLRTKAASLEFSESDLAAIEPLAALAEPDDTERDRKLREVIEDGSDRAQSSEARLTAMLVEDPGVVAAKPRASRPKPEVFDAPAADDGEDGDKGGGNAPTARSKDGSSDAAAELARQGIEALRTADRDQAERLFNQALAKDSRNARALYGLASIHFDRGAYGKSAKYGRRAVSISPSNGEYRIKLGDALYKNFEYDEAHKHYTKAKQLGHADADNRIAKVADKTRGG